MLIIKAILEAVGGLTGLFLLFILIYQLAVGVFGFRKKTKDYADHDPEARFLALIQGADSQRGRH